MLRSSLPDPNKKDLRKKSGEAGAGGPGWLSQLSVQLLVSVQVMITVGGIEPHVRLHAHNTKPAWDSLSLPLSLSLSLSLSLPHPRLLSLSQNK